jgi:hypothetical protein
MAKRLGWITELWEVQCKKLIKLFKQLCITKLCVNLALPACLWVNCIASSFKFGKLLVIRQLGRTTSSSVCRNHSRNCKTRCDAKCSTHRSCR